MKSDTQQHPFHRHPHHHHHHHDHNQQPPTPPHSLSSSPHPPPPHHHPPHPHITNPYSSQSTPPPSSSHNSSFSSADDTTTTNTNNPHHQTTTTTTMKKKEAFHTSLCCITNLTPTQMEWTLYTLHFFTLCLLSIITVAFFSSDAPFTRNFWKLDQQPQTQPQQASSMTEEEEDEDGGGVNNTKYKAMLLSITIWLYGYTCIKSGDKMECVWLYERKKRLKLFQRWSSLEEEYESGLRRDAASDENVNEEEGLQHRETLNEEEEQRNTKSGEQDEGGEKEEDEYLDNEPHHSTTTTTTSTIIRPSTPTPTPKQQQKVKHIVSPILYYTLFYLSLGLSNSILSLHIFTTCDDYESAAVASCMGTNTQRRIQSLSMYLFVSLPLFLVSLYFLVPTTDKSKILNLPKWNGGGGNIIISSAIVGPSGASLYASIDLGCTCWILLLHPHKNTNVILLWCSFVVGLFWIYACFDLCLWMSGVGLRRKEREVRKSLEEERRKRLRRRRRRRGGRERFMLVSNEEEEEEEQQQEENVTNCSGEEVEEEEDAFQDDETKENTTTKKEEHQEKEIILIAGTHHPDTNHESTSTSSPLSPALTWSLSLASINIFFTLLDLAYNGGRTVLGNTTVSTVNNDLTNPASTASLYYHNRSLTIVTFVLYSVLVWVGIMTATTMTKVCGIGGVCMMLVRITYFCLYGGDDDDDDKENESSAKMKMMIIFSSSFWMYIVGLVEIGCVFLYSTKLELFLVRKLQHLSLSRKIWDTIVRRFVRDRKKRWMEEEEMWVAQEMGEEGEEEGVSDVELRLSGGSGGGGEGGDNHHGGGVAAASAGRRGRQKNWWKRRPSSLDLMSYLLNKDEEEEEEEERRMNYDENNKSPWKCPAVDEVAEEGVDGLMLEDDDDEEIQALDEITGDSSSNSVAGVGRNEKNSDTTELL